MTYHHSNVATLPCKDMRGSGDHINRKHKSNDPGNNRKLTLVPSRSLEKWAVAKYIYIAGFSVESSGRRFNQYDAWNDLSKFTTKLKDEDENIVQNAGKRRCNYTMKLQLVMLQRIFL